MSLIIRIHVAATHRDKNGLERVGGNAYLVDEEKAYELAALVVPGTATPVLERRLEAADADDEDAVEAVAALAAELFPTPPKEA